MKKKIFWYAVAFVFAAFLFLMLTEYKSNTITAKIEGLKEGDKVVLSEYPADELGIPVPFDSTIVGKNGGFRVKIKQRNDLVFVSVIPQGQNFNHDDADNYINIPLFLEGYGKTCIKGSADSLGKLNIKSRVSLDIKQNEEKVDKYIAENPRSYFSAYLLRYDFMYRRPMSETEEQYGKLGQNVQRSKWGREVKKMIDNDKTSRPGQKAPSFTLVTTDFDEVFPEKYLGKLLLIEFWGSWCRPCRAFNPHLVELYNRYHKDGFEITGIACRETNESRWRKAIEKDGLVWKQANNNEKREGQPYVNDLYAVKSYPTSVLIDRTGTIIFNGNPDEKLDALIAEQMGN